MSAGRIEQVDVPWRIYEAPSTLGIARFVGDLVELPVAEIDAQSARTPLGSVPLSPNSNTNARVVVLRPEQLVLVGDDPLLDVAAARKAGWDAALFTSADRLIDDLARRGLDLGL